MDIRIVALASLVAALAACGSASRADAPPRGPAAATATPPDASGMHGVATYVARVKMPPGATLRVELIDAASQAVLGSTTLQDVGGPPIAFALARPRGTAPLALRATLDGPDGMRWFETPAPVPAPPGDAAVELRMRRASSAAPTPVAPVGAVAHWECGEVGVMSRFDAGGRVRLDFDGRSLVLPLARSASGARYADDTHGEFWTKGATGTLTLAGEPPRDCVQAAQASPWNAALLRGVAFRAVGSEPGWTAEAAGEPPRLDALLDYGARHVVTPLRAVRGGYEGTDPQRPVRLRITRGTCRDGMSGQAFEASVELDVDGRTYRGCGADLLD